MSTWTKKAIEAIKKGGGKIPEPVKTLKPLHTLLLEYTGRRGISTERLAELAGFSRAYGYSIMNGEKTPDEDKIICMAFVLGLDEEETNGLLKSAGKATLSGQTTRDTLILFGLIKKLSLGDMNDLLVQRGKKALY